MSKWTVTRQVPFYANVGRDKPLHVVAINAGDLDNANPGMQTPARWSMLLGDGKTFDSAQNAAEAAIKIRDAWKPILAATGLSFDSIIAIGNTHGGSFELAENEERTDEELLKYAKDRDEEDDVDKIYHYFDDYEGDDDD